jgi:hypothetical protein
LELSYDGPVQLGYSQQHFGRGKSIKPRENKRESEKEDINAPNPSLDSTLFLPSSKRFDFGSNGFLFTKNPSPLSSPLSPLNP